MTQPKTLGDREMGVFRESPTRGAPFTQKEVFAPETEDQIQNLRNENQTNFDAVNANLVELELRVGDETETAAATDTSTSGLNGLLKRIAQRLTTLIQFFFSTSATLTQVPASVTSVTLLASNSSRKGFILINTSNKDAYVAFAATATTTAYSVFMVGGGTTFSSDLPIYTGQITAIWTGTGGDMKVTAW